MTTETGVQRLERAAEQLAQYAPQYNGRQVVTSLSSGVLQLRNTLVKRVRDDVADYFGADSMLGAVSERDIAKRDERAKLEIEVYAALVLHDEIEACRYVGRQPDWLLGWLLQVRLGNNQQPFVQDRLREYANRDAESRRHKFASRLDRTILEATRAPLVVYRLFPRCLRIVAASAFGDPLRAQELRAEQERFLPSIGDCPSCHGAVLDNEETCPSCENPLWAFPWLQAAD